MSQNGENSLNKLLQIMNVYAMLIIWFYILKAYPLISFIFSPTPRHILNSLFWLI
jgi:hypothetical protein